MTILTHTRDSHRLIEPYGMKFVFRACTLLGCEVHADIIRLVPVPVAPMDVVAVTDSGSLDLRWAARCSSQNTQLPVIVSSSSLTWLGSDSGEVFRADSTGTGRALRLSHVGRWTLNDGTLRCSIGYASASSTHYLTISIVFRRPLARSAWHEPLGDSLIVTVPQPLTPRAATEPRRRVVSPSTCTDSQ